MASEQSGDPFVASPKPEVKAHRGHFPWFAAIRRRIVSGLIFALPIVITIWVVYWLLSTLQNVLLDPGARIVRRGFTRAGLNTDNLPWWWDEYVSPLVALVLVLVFLYFLGHFGRTRLSKALDWLILRLPIVSVIFKAVRNVFTSLGDTQNSGKFKRVVSIPFPSAEVRSPAFVTRTMTDVNTGRSILSVYLPYCPIPTTGLILLVPESEVRDLDWDVNVAMQAVISFGITTPTKVVFDKPPSAAVPLGG